MNPTDLQAAHRIRGVLSPPARNVAGKALASRLRKMGLAATLRWLEGKKGAEYSELCSILCVELDLGSPAKLSGLARQSNLKFLTTVRRIRGRLTPEKAQQQGNCARVEVRHETGDLGVASAPGHQEASWRPLQSNISSATCRGSLLPPWSGGPPACVVRSSAKDPWTSTLC